MSALSQIIKLENERRDRAKKRPKGLQVTIQDFRYWIDKVLVFDVIKGLRPGQSFCNYFHITDYVLMYSGSEFDYPAYIKKMYIGNAYDSYANADNTKLVV